MQKVRVKFDLKTLFPNPTSLRSFPDNIFYDNVCFVT